MPIDPQRRDAIVEALAASELHALACFSPIEVLLLTGYWPVMGSSVAFVTRDGAALAVVPQDELELAQTTAHAELIPYQPHSLEKITRLSEVLIDPITLALRRLDLAAAQIGTEFHDSVQPMPYQATNHFRESIVALLRQCAPQASFVSADNLLGRLKAVKTPLELDRIRHASRLAGAGFREAAKAISPGRREDEVAADIEAAFAKVAHDGFERGRGYFFCMSGPNAAAAAGAYARTRRRVIENGDTVMVHANTVGDGYWTDVTRTWIAGLPSEQQRRMQSAITEARAAALNSIAPGVAARAVDAAAREVLQKHGFAAEFTHATGHGVGFAAVNPDALPRIHPRSPDILQAGMTFNIEPAIYIDGVGGMRHCDVVACAASGAEVFTDF